MPLFIDCLLEQDYTILIPFIKYPAGAEKRDPTAEELGELWIKLYSEYCELSASSAMDSIIMQIWQRDCMESKIVVVKKMLSIMTEGYNQTLAECLALYGFPIIGSDDPNAYEKQIRVQQARLKGEEYKLQKIREVLKSVESGQDEVTKTTFRKQLISISKHNGYRLKMDELTVAEYCDYIKDYRDYVEFMNNKNEADAG